MDNQQPYQKKPHPDEKKQNSGHHISNTEWGLVIGALALIDIAQVILDLFGIGLAINRFIDIITGAGLWLYVKLRCKNITFGKTVMSMIATFIGEEIPVVDVLPLWTLDGIYYMTLERAGEKANKTIAKIPGANLIATAYAMKKETGEEKNKTTDSKTHQPLKKIPDTQKNPNTPKAIKDGPGKLLDIQKYQGPTTAKAYRLSKFKWKRDRQMKKFNEEFKNNLSKITKLEIQNGKIVNVPNKYIDSHFEQENEKTPREIREDNILELADQIKNQKNFKKDPQAARERLEQFESEHVGEGFDENIRTEEF